MLDKYSKTKLLGKRIYLRPMRADDAEFIVAARNHPKVKKWFFNQESLTIESHLKWFLKLKQDRIDFIICLQDNDTPIGTLNFIDIDPNKRNAELGKLLAPDYWGQGYIQDALAVWFEFGLGKMKLNKIRAKTLDTNIKNIKLNQRFGFKIIDDMYDEHIVDEVTHNVVLMELENQTNCNNDERI